MPPVNRISLLQGNDFQDFCSVLLSACDPSFQAVNGRGGDQGNDGFSISGNVAYQAYGPHQITLGKLRSKIDETIRKIAAHTLPTGGQTRRLVLLTPEDLSIEQHRYLQQAAQHAGVDAESWGHSRLLSLLASHPQVKDEFPDLFIPDLRGMMETLQETVQRTSDATTVFGSEPDLYVLQNDDERPGQAPHRSYSYFRLTVTGPGLGRQGFEPEAEDAFLELIHTYFWDNETAAFEESERTASLIPVEHRDPQLAFHFRWGWYAAGHFAIAGTLTDLHRPGTYSAADLAVQVTRGLQLAGLLGQGDALVRFTLKPHHLKVNFDPSDRRARERLGATLAGIGTVPKPQIVGETYPVRWQVPCRLEDLGGGAHLIGGSLIVHALRDLHAARISTPAFQQSILQLIDSGLRARLL